MTVFGLNLVNLRFSVKICSSNNSTREQGLKLINKTCRACFNTSNKKKTRVKNVNY